MSSADTGTVKVIDTTTDTIADRISRFAATLIEKRIAKDTKEPRLQMRPGHEALTASQTAREGLLHQVLGDCRSRLSRHANA